MMMMMKHMIIDKAHVISGPDLTIEEVHVYRYSKLDGKRSLRQARR